MYFIIDVVRNLFSLYTTCLVIYALLSWFPGGYQSKVGEILTRICAPYLNIFERLNLSFGGLSFNILVAVIVLQFIEKVVLNLLYGLLF